MSREIMQQALTVLKAWDAVAWRTLDTIEGLETALAQPEQTCCCGEPTALGVVHRKDNPCYVAQPEQEPVCDKDPSLCGFTLCQLAKVCKHTPRNTMPTKIFAPNLEQMLNAAGFYRREWVGLTDDEIKKIMQRWRNGYIDIKDVEQLLKDKNI